MINSMLNNSGLPHNLWGEALFTTNYILNMISFKKTNKSPYNLQKGWISTYKILEVWGYLEKVLIPLLKRTKLETKTINCVFIDFAKQT